MMWSYDKRSGHANGHWSQVTSPFLAVFSHVLLFVYEENVGAYELANEIEAKCSAVRRKEVSQIFDLRFLVIPHRHHIFFFASSILLRTHPWFPRCTSQAMKDFLIGGHISSINRLIRELHMSRKGIGW